MTDEISIPESLNDTRPFIRNWQFFVIVVMLAVGLAGGVWVLSNQSGDRALARSQKNTSERNDCRATIQAARRDVIDNYTLMLGIDTARNHQIFIDGLLNQLDTGTKSPELRAAIRESQDDLDRDEGLAATLVQHLPDVDDIVNHGGDIPMLELNPKVSPGVVAPTIVRFDPKVVSQRFAPCPTVT